MWRALRLCSTRTAARAHSRPALLTAIASLALASCTLVGPDFVPLEPEIVGDWSLPSAPGIEPAAAAPVRWWETFDDAILNELVDMARAQNLALEVAALRVLEARAQLGIATGLRYPQVQVASGDATFVAPAESDVLELLDVGDFWRYGLGTSVAWEADFWGRYRRGIEAAEAGVEASVAAYDQAVVLLTAQVVSAYAVVREIEEQLRISRENVDLQQRSFEITRTRFEQGEDSELDMQQALSLLLSTQATIAPLQAALQQAKNALSRLLGRAPGHVDALLARGTGLPVVPPELAVGLAADMLRSRPDVRQAEFQAMVQNAIVGLATADLYPSFQLVGTLGLSAGGPGDTSFSDLFSSDAIAATLGGNFVWPFLNYDRIKNNIRVEDARLQQALLNYQDIVVQAAREAADAIAGITGSREQAFILAEGVISAQRSNEISVLRYREGFSDYQRVLDSQQRLFTQQQRYVTNQAETIQNAVALYKALGGGWQDRSGMPALDEETLELMRERTDWGDFLIGETR